MLSHSIMQVERLNHDVTTTVSYLTNILMHQVDYCYWEVSIL